MAWLAELVARIVSALLTFWSGERARAEADDAHSRAGAADAALETQEAINDAADARAGLPAPPADPNVLAGELRAERTAASPSRRRRPF